MTNRPNPFSNEPFMAYPSGLRAQRSSVAVYHRYRLLSNNLSARYARLLVQASKAEGVGELPEVGAHHLAHNWHLCRHGEDCSTSQVLLRYRRLSTMLSLRQDREQHAADHATHVADGEAGRYLWCDGCQRGPAHTRSHSAEMTLGMTLYLRESASGRLLVAAGS